MDIMMVTKNHYHLLLLLFMRIQFCSNMLDKENGNEQDHEMLCNKSYFIEKYVMTDFLLFVSDVFMDIKFIQGTVPQRIEVSRMKSKCKILCSGAAYPFIALGRPNISFVQTRILHLTKTEKCWGYLLKLTENETLVYQNYVNFFQKNTIMKALVPYELSMHYVASLINFPDGKENAAAIYGATTDCGRRISKKMADFYWSTQDGCTAYVDQHLVKLADQFCEYYPENDDATFNETVGLKRCALFFIRKSKANARKVLNTNKIYGSISAALLIVILVSIFVRYKVTKKKTRLHQKTVRDTKSVIRTGHAPSVMIIHRPGCELLDVLIRDLAYILKSFNIDVTCALLEQSSIDAQGGISSYMQRNIDSCNNIIIVLTESSKETTIHRQKPFEFTLRILAGLAFNGDNVSRFIPVYLTNYKKAVHLLPPFLLASTNCGYLIPEELDVLISYIQEKKIDVDSEYKIKLNFFLGKIKSQVKKILTSQHIDCYTATCTKGIINDAESELWPSETRSSTTEQTGISLSKACKQHNSKNPSCNVSDEYKVERNSTIQNLNNITGSPTSVTQIVNKNINIQCWRNTCFVYEEQDEEEVMKSSEETLM